MRVPGRILLLAALLGFPSPGLAHPVPFSFLDLRLSASVVEGSLVVHNFDVAQALGFESAERLSDPLFAREQSRALARVLGQGLQLSIDGRKETPVWSEPEVLPERQSVRLTFRLQVARRPASLSVRARLFPYDPNHRTFLNIYEREGRTQAILGIDRPHFDYYSGNPEGRIAVIQRFLPAGVEHILVGPDHVLFLVGLLLLGGTIRRLALIVTAFTAAHTMTLSLAALSLLNPPARIIEPLIALSIVYVGADNLLRREGRDTRAWIAFAFGFIHGFGFAYVLREMALPPRALGWSLFSFNLGVEIGQLLIVAILASVLAFVRARSEKAGRWIAVSGSVAVIAAGLFWYIERVFFPGGIS